MAYTQLASQLNTALRERDTVLFGGTAQAREYCIPAGDRVPGSVTMFGPFAFPLVIASVAGKPMDEPHVAHRCMAAASCLGPGRIVAIAHESFIHVDGDHGREAPEFWNRCSAWLGGWRNIMIVRPADDIERARRHLQSGGACIAASCSWGWLQCNPGKSLARHHPLNKLLVDAGLVFNGDMCSVHGGQFRVVPTAQCRPQLVASMLSAFTLAPGTLAQLAAAGGDIGFARGDDGQQQHQHKSLQPIQRNAEHLVAVHPPENIDSARAAYREGGWWAPSSDRPSLTFDMRKHTTIGGIELWCVNVDAAPKQVSILASRDGRSWDHLASFPFATRNLPGQEQNKAVRFPLNAPITAQHFRVQLNGIHRGPYIGINDVRFLAHEFACPDPSAACCFNAVEAIPDAHRRLVARSVADAVSGALLDPPCAKVAVKADTENGRATRVLYAVQPFLEPPQLLPGAHDFPGRDRTAPLAEVTTGVPAAAYKQGWWASTMLWVNAGEPFTVTPLPLAPPHQGRAYGGDWQLRVGCHKDDNCNLPEWFRWPRVTHCVALPAVGQSLTVTPPFGGLVYLECLKDQPNDAPTFNIRLQNVHRATFFTRATGLVRGTAPWGEVEGDKFIMSLPAERILEADARGDLWAATDYWDAVIRSHQRLATPPYGGRKERIVPDQQISAGYMHSGYPVMAHLDFAERALDMAKMMTEGDWGMYHELGHNMQRGWWTWPGTGEVTVNLFTVYSMHHVLHRGIEMHAPYQEVTRKRVVDYMKGGKKRDVWNGDPFMALYLYLQLIHHFGFPALEQVLRTYEQQPTLQRDNLSDDEKMAVWARVYSNVVGRDLTPFFHDWGFTAVRVESNLPPWRCNIP